jgi:hypothetical protein
MPESSEAKLQSQVNPNAQLSPGDGVPEKAKRLEPKKEVLRELFLKSGNLCAFTSCERLMLNIEGVFIGQLCHIEAAEDGGERFNDQMTNEDRRAAANLMLMCYEHHTVTNDVDEDPVERLRQIKRDHEIRFSHPDRAILSGLKDYTKSFEATRPSNLGRMRKLLDWPDLSDEDVAEYVRKVNEYIDKFSRVPLELRNFVGQVAMRIDRMRDLPVVNEGGLGCPSIRVSDLTGAFHMSDDTLYKLATGLESYKIAYLTEIADPEYDSLHHALRLWSVDDWCLWDDVARFVELSKDPIETFCVDMDFGRLDEE